MAKIISHKTQQSGIALGGIGTGSVEISPTVSSISGRSQTRRDGLQNFLKIRRTTAKETPVRFPSGYAFRKTDALPSSASWV